MRALSPIPLALLLLAPSACHDDCKVPSTPIDSKIAPHLRDQMRTATEETSIPIVVTAVDLHAVECVNQAIIDNQGPIARGVPKGSRDIWATLSSQGIESLAARADVQSIDASN